MLGRAINLSNAVSSCWTCTSLRVRLTAGLEALNLPIVVRIHDPQLGQHYHLDKGVAPGVLRVVVVVWPEKGALGASRS